LERNATLLILVTPPLRHSEKPRSLLLPF